jgi:hypothetical protein
MEYITFLKDMFQTVNIPPYLSAIATLVLAYVAIKQRQLSKQQYDLQRRQQKFEELRLKRELYDRRLGVYQAVKVFLASIRPGLEINFDQILNFTKDTADSDFLFEGDEISQYISEIGLKATQLSSVEAQLKTPRHEVPPDKWEKLVHQQTKLRLWLAEQPSNAKAKFRPYLTITE